MRRGILSCSVDVLQSPAYKSSLIRIPIWLSWHERSPGEGESTRAKYGLRETRRSRMLLNRGGDQEYRQPTKVEWTRTDLIEEIGSHRIMAIWME